MSLRRSVICDSGRSQVFHVISRVVDRNFIFDELEKDKFLEYMRLLEAFSGVEVLSYCLMGNHFHLLLHVPEKPKEISNDEVRARMLILYGQNKMAEIDSKIKEQCELGNSHLESDVYDRIRMRLFNLSSYVRDLKLRFSKWFNNENERKGTLWEERFRSVMVEPSENAMMRVSAYIELNPVRAELVDQPHEYRWCSFTEAVAGGNKARRGIIKIVEGLNGSTNWDKAHAIYRSYFLHQSASRNTKNPDKAADDYHDAMLHGGDLDQNEILKTRLRYFTEGAVLGTQDFLDEFLQKHRDLIGTHRKKSGYKVEKGKSGLFAYRKVT